MSAAETLAAASLCLCKVSLNFCGFYFPLIICSFFLFLGVGKSCLLLQFTDKRFQPVHDLTIGKFRKELNI